MTPYHSHDSSTKPLTLSARGPSLYVRMILTYTDGFRAERIKIFLMVVDPWYRYSNGAEKAN